MSYSILLGVPSTGKSDDDNAKLRWNASLEHKVGIKIQASSCPNFTPLWVYALNQAAKGRITHFAMTHTDIALAHGITQPNGKRWVDCLVDEMERAQVPYLSVANAIKDLRGVTSCGIGKRGMRWSPYRRFTVRELNALPVTFKLEDTGYSAPDFYLLHNQAMCLWDLRDERWFQHSPERDGGMGFRSKLCFNFKQSVYYTGDKWVYTGESEDWYYSRAMAELGIPSAITTAVELSHIGLTAFDNVGDWGEYEHDEDSRDRWGEDGVEIPSAESRAKENPES